MCRDDIRQSPPRTEPAHAAPRNIRLLKDVPDFALIVGNPGRFIGWVNEKGERLEFSEDGKSNCARFFLENNKVVLVENH